MSDKVTDDDIRTLVVKLMGWHKDHYLPDGIYWKPVSPEEWQQAIRVIVDQAAKIERERCAALAIKIEIDVWKAFKSGDGPERGDPYFEGVSDGAGRVADAIKNS